MRYAKAHARRWVVHMIKKTRKVENKKRISKRFESQWVVHMIKKTRKVENKKRISKRFESQRPVRNIEEVLADMDETARGIMRYGVENAGIADLMGAAEQNLDADYWKADKEGDEETKKAIEDEMERMENEATECCGKIIDAIDSVWPVSELTPAQKQRLGWELDDLKAYDTRAMEDPNTFVKLIVAEYALSEDNGLLEALEFACQNALDETEEIDMDESVQRRRRNLRRVIESRRARAKKESKRRVSKCRKFENALYNELELIEGTYVLMQDVDRYDDVDYDTRREAVAAMIEAQDDGEEDMWVGCVERINGRLEIMFVEGESA